MKKRIKYMALFFFKFIPPCFVIYSFGFCQYILDIITLTRKDKEQRKTFFEKAQSRFKKY